MDIQPLGERVVLQPQRQEEKTKGGIFIPESAREKKKQGVVVAVGEAEKPIPLAKGDLVLYGGYSNEEITMGDEEYVIVDYKDILAKLR